MIDGRHKKKKNIPLRECIVCHQVIPRNTKLHEKRISPAQYIKAEFCSNKCRGIWRSIYKVGENNPNYRGGKTHCCDCGKELAARYTSRKTLRCKECWYRFWREHPEESPNWKGGITPLLERVRHCFQYRQWRSDVFTRDNFTCQICGDDRGHNLIPHHKKFFSIIWEEYNIQTFQDAINCEELWNINNGITLCEKCHIQLHKNLINKQYEI